MLKALFVICLCLATEVLAADFFTEVQTTKTQNTSYNQVNVGVSGGGQTIGYFGFGTLSSTGYQEAYAGPRVTLADWIEIGVAVGAEKTASSEWMRRGAGYVRIASENVALLGIYENGGTGPWHKLVLTYNVTPVFAVGIQNQAFLGTGLRAEYSLGKSMSVSGAMLRGDSGTTAIATVKFKF